MEISRYSFKDRHSKVSAENFAKISDSLIDLIPDILQGQNFKKLAKKIRDIRGKKGFVAGFGAHLIKCGLSPILIKMVKDGYITSLATNGASVIHDFEIAAEGRTSEDVERALKEGKFGMAFETCSILNRLFTEAAQSKKPFCEVYGAYIEANRLNYKYLEHSLFYQAYISKIPVTVHVALGTDIIHMHPEASGSDIGQVSMDSFRQFIENIKTIKKGGIFFNIGSAVILPEVFLKAISYLRNIDPEFGGFTTAVFDFNIHYRPMQNVVNRPKVLDSEGYYFVGNHEILLPLLYYLLDKV